MTFTSKHGAFKSDLGHKMRWLFIRVGVPFSLCYVSLQLYVRKTGTRGVTILDNETCERRDLGQYARTANKVNAG